MYRSSALAGIVLLAIDASAGLRLPSSTALPAMALALEKVLEAALLSKFMALVVLQMRRKNKYKTTGSQNQMLWHKIDVLFPYSNV